MSLHHLYLHVHVDSARALARVCRIDDWVRDIWIRMDESKSCHTKMSHVWYECSSTRICMSHITHEGVMSHVHVSYHMWVRDIWIRMDGFMSRADSAILLALFDMSHVTFEHVISWYRCEGVMTCTNEPCHVLSALSLALIVTGGVSHINVPCHMWMCRVTCECVMSFVNASCHMWMCHVTCECVMPRALCTCAWYGVATTCRLLKIIGLFCRISPLLQGSFSKETYNFKEPTNLSLPICLSQESCHVWVMSQMNESCHV